MSGDQIERLVYLGLLGTAVAGYFIAANRRRLGELARHAMLWGLIFVGVIAGFGLWSDIRDDVIARQSVVADGSRIEVPRAFDGHYYLTLALNGTPVQFVVDTGASEIVLSQDDARRVGLDPATLIYSGSAGTANGVVRTARVTLEQVALGPVVDHRVPAWVNQGEMNGSLLGMTYLQRFDRIEIADGRLVLER